MALMKKKDMPLPNHPFMDTRQHLIRLAESHCLDDWMTMALDTIEPLTDSCISFLHFVSQDEQSLTLQQWSTRTRTEFCTTPGKHLHYSVDRAGIWADSIREKKPVIHNDYMAMARKKGLPQGHAPIVRELVVPVIRENRVKALMGVGNKPAPYTRADARNLSFYADVVWEIIEKKQVEQDIVFQKDIESDLSRLATLLLTTTSLEKIADHVLDAAKRLTNSSYGFVGTFDDQHKRFISHTMTKDIWHECQIPDKSIVFEKYCGLWGWVLQNQTPVMANDMDNDPRSSGTPEGHIKIQAFLGVPAMIDGRVAGQIALANPVDAYKDIDLTIVKRLATLFAMAIQRHRYEESLLSFQTKKAETFEKLVQKRTAELQKSQERLSLILDSVSDAIWDWRIDTKDVYFSPRYYTMLGYSPYELPQDISTWEMLIHPEDRSMALETVNRHLVSSEPFEMEFRMQTRDKGYRWILGRGKTVEKDGTGKALRMVGTHMDITDRKNMGLRMRHSQKMEAMGVLAGGIAHDFNNILAAIVGYAELVMEEIPEKTQAARRVSGILSASERARSLISQILTFSRKKESTLHAMDPRVVMKEAVNFMRASLPSTLQISRNIAADLPPIKGDPTQIHQLVVNLAANAAQAMNQTGTLTISLAFQNLDSGFTRTLPDLDPGPFVKLSVSDTGCGIPADILPKIFDPFFTTKEKGQGTGLGLATVHGIVKEHGGEIIVDSTPGKGTCFDVFLPAAAQKMAAEKKNSQRPRRGNEHLLVVDDEQVLPYIVQDMLEELGYTVTTMTDSQQALSLFEKQPDRFDMLLSDITMPHVNGIELTRFCHTIRPHLPVILWTGNSSVTAKQKARDTGAVCVLQKPFKRNDLSLAIRKALDDRTNLS
ncbi:MAG TPA: GAF domain-containing protein [Desulfotignum sp.]|nr:GAF domain-containing protein [Desulfotignum sp.]